MTPEQISFVAAIAAVVERIGAWPIGGFVMMIVLGPWILQFFFSRAQEKRFEAVSKMYENNVELLKTTQSLAENSQDLVIHNIQVMEKVYNVSKNNLFCPIVRKNTQQKEIG
jgi:hypothetical protein